MKSFRLTSAMPSALIAAVMLLGGAQVRAGYVALPTLVGHESGHSLVHSPISPLGESETSTGTSDSSEATQRLPEDNDPKLPMGPVVPSRKLPYTGYTFTYGSGSSSSSSSASTNLSSSSAAGFSPRPQIPPLELSSLLPPETGAAHPFSVASFLFRPPRRVA